MTVPSVRSTMGRPSVEPERRKKNQVSTNLSDIELERFNEAVALSGKTKADWLRELISERLARSHEK